jgi:hypothetical protein
LLGQPLARALQVRLAHAAPAQRPTQLPALELVTQLDPVGQRAREHIQARPHTLAPGGAAVLGVALHAAVQAALDRVRLQRLQPLAGLRISLGRQRERDRMTLPAGVTEAIVEAHRVAAGRDRPVDLAVGLPGGRGFSAAGP